MSRKQSALVVSPRASRFTLVRHLVVFQVKLAIDGLKDLVLAPVSLAAGLVGILLGASDRMGPLRRVLRMGRAFDDYVDLYASIEAMEGKPAKPNKLDSHLAEAERAVADHVSTRQSRIG